MFIRRVVRYFIPLVFRLIPTLRLNSVKTFLLNLAGHKVGKRVVIASTVLIKGNFNAHIGDATFIGHETMILGGTSDIYIGANCDTSSRVNLVMGSHEIDSKNLRSAGKGVSKSIIIEDGVWIGFGVIILPGVKIGKKAIIGAGSVVTKDIPANSVAVGNPCKVIKHLG